MTPASFVRLDRLPLTRRGKVDYEALPEPEGAGEDYVEPRTELEGTIAGVWQSVLRVKRVSAYENFFDLGGHSLLLVQAHRELCEKLGRRLSVTELFQHPTVESLARHLGGEGAGENLFESAGERTQKYAPDVERRRRLMRERRRAGGR
jgi:acyl carrier protein